MQRTFKTKIGVFTYILLLVTIILLFYSMWIKSIVFLIIMLIINVLFVPTFIHTEYVVNGDMLYIKSGYLPVIKVDIHTINFISRTKTSIPFLYPKGYVLSIDSITLHYENKKFSISPYDQKGFINELTKHNPYIKVISVGS